MGTTAYYTHCQSRTADRKGGGLRYGGARDVLMPEHGHPLIGPGEHANPPAIMQKLSERTANFILRSLRRKLARPWCEKLLKRCERA